MKWSDKLRALDRGIKLTLQIVRAKLRQPRATSQPAAPEQTSWLVECNDFGDNPGRLRMLANVPPSIALRPLVLLLHGCGQSAVQFAEDTGWIALSNRLRFPLLLPEQARTNNTGRCFQWFLSADTARDKGEAGSIAAMTRAAISRFGSDPARVFIVGLSAGGAMTAAMLAAYPDLFAAGASVAGLPVGTARSGMQAILRMALPGPDRRPKILAAKVLAAGPAGFAGRWPRLSVWHGTADTTVAPDNGRLLATQWRALHGLTGPAITEPGDDAVQHQMWPDDTRPLVELWSLAHLPHAYPVGAGVAFAPDRFVKHAAIDATAGIARFFGLD